MTQHFALARTLMTLFIFSAVSAWPLPAWSTTPVSWDALANITTTVANNQPVTGFDSAAIALNGKQVELDGYMTPFNLGSGSTVTVFLMTGTPGTCPFCMGAGPEDFVIVTAVEPVSIDITAEIKLTGRFEVVPNDLTGFYYKLDSAKIAR